MCVYTHLPPRVNWIYTSRGSLGRFSLEIIGGIHEASGCSRRPAIELSSDNDSKIRSDMFTNEHEEKWQGEKKARAQRQA